MSRQDRRRRSPFHLAPPAAHRLPLDQLFQFRPSPRPKDKIPHLGYSNITALIASAVSTLRVFVMTTRPCFKAGPACVTRQAFRAPCIMRFTFIHAADLHIDSPLAGLRLKDEDVARRFANAGRWAVQALIEETIAGKAAFLIIAGDVFDGDWKDVTTGLFFVRAISALHRAGIPTFIVKGNHDADSLMARDLPYPDSVNIFPSSKAESIALDAYRVRLHGRSFPNRLTGEFVETYPARRDGWLNIGVLHTSVDGTRGPH